MSEPHDYQSNAKNLAVDILRKDKSRTIERIQEVAEKAANAQRLFDASAIVDVEQLTAELRHLFSVAVESATVLEDLADHVPWLPSRRAQIRWRYWGRYMTYLERDFGMPPAVVSSLDDLTNMVLERLEDPARKPPWDRRGMVVGSVQSGKTANYTGLICKAVDAGYKIVIVLAGIHNNLRAQTQLRIDDGVLGFDTQKSRRLNNDSRWIGVGKIPGDKLVIHSLTSSAENGDFSKIVAETIGVMLGGDPVVLVVKKNSRLLDNLLNWVLHVAGVKDADSEKERIGNIPLLLIDDEADNASINTNSRPDVSDEDSVTAINGKIRMLLDSFQCSAYVGYTATPFANIFINPESESPKHGKDLFPRNFIINVKPPSNYIGPARVFGLDSDPDAGIVGSDGLPIVTIIEDYAEAFPPGHKIDCVPAFLPASLQKALRCFVLTCAARRARGQGKRHNSMLVHVTRFVAVQGHVVTLIQKELKALQLRIEMGDGKRKPTLIEELEKLWQDEYMPVSKMLAADAGPEVTWHQVRDELHAAASRIGVLAINGYAKEVLDYRDHEAEGLSVIAIGGDKLSRGLTLEGLSISYFLRTSRMYDTLMQMGRWFGYRPGYLDLCRLFTTRTLKSWYRHIALAEEELRREFDYMVAAGLTPENYGLRVRTHPDGMIVTALNKMSHGRTLELSWAGVLAQTTQLPKEPMKIDHNLKETERLLKKLPKPRENEDGDSWVWSEVDAENIAKFVESLKLPPASARASGEQMAAFIRKQTEKPGAELTRWTVALLSNSRAASDNHRTLEAYDVGLFERSPEEQSDTSYALRKANILNPSDEGIDFKGVTFDQGWFDAIVGKPALADDLEWLKSQLGTSAENVALQLTIRWQNTEPVKIRRPPTGKTNRANGRVLRVLRRTTDGLLLIYPLLQPAVVPMAEGQSDEPTGMDPKGPPVIGVALSFPASETAVGVEYRVNRVWGAEVQEDAAYED